MNADPMPELIPTQEITQPNWMEYYRLRRWARIGLLGFVLAAFCVPIVVAVAAHNLPTAVELALFFVSMAATAIVCFRPLVRWFNWRCPRCGEKFAEPKASRAWLKGPQPVHLLIPLLWRLAVNSRCGSCKLACGESALATS
jgi:hypothetical protein